MPHSISRVVPGSISPVTGWEVEADVRHHLAGTLADVDDEDRMPIGCGQHLSIRPATTAFRN